MSLVVDDISYDPDRLLPALQQMAEVIDQQNASLASLKTKRDAVRVERDAARAEIERLRLLIRQLQRDQFGRVPGDDQVTSKPIRVEAMRPQAAGCHQENGSL
jgi:hypothetical protein